MTDANKTEKQKDRERKNQEEKSAEPQLGWAKQPTVTKQSTEPYALDVDARMLLRFLGSEWLRHGKQEFSVLPEVGRELGLNAQRFMQVANFLVQLELAEWRPADHFHLTITEAGIKAFEQKEQMDSVLPVLDFKDENSR